MFTHPVFAALHGHGGGDVNSLALLLSQPASPARPCQWGAWHTTSIDACAPCRSIAARSLGRRDGTTPRRGDCAPCRNTAARSLGGWRRPSLVAYRPCHSTAARPQGGGQPSPGAYAPCLSSVARPLMGHVNSLALWLAQHALVARHCHCGGGHSPGRDTCAPCISSRHCRSG